MSISRKHTIRMIPGLTIAGLFFAGFLSVAVALAETYTLASGDTIEPAPDSTLAVTGFYGITTGPPPAGGSVHGTRAFDVYNSSGDKIGSFEAFVSDNTSNVSSGTNEEMLVSHALSGTGGTGLEDVPQVGSVMDFYSGTGLASNYSDLASTTGGQNVVADTVNTIFGSFNFPSALDASEHVDAHVEQPIPLADGYSIVADPDSPETFSSVSAIPPVYVAGQGNQLFDLSRPQRNGQLLLRCHAGSSSRTWSMLSKDHPT